MTPVFTVMLNVLFLKKTYSSMTYTSLVPVSVLFVVMSAIVHV